MNSTLYLSRLTAKNVQPFNSSAFLSALRGRILSVRRLAGTQDVRCNAAIEEGWLWQTMSASKTKQQLENEGLRAKKSLGQNFLVDDEVLEKIVAEAGVRLED